MPTYTVTQRKEIAENLAFGAICKYSSFAPKILSDASKFARRDLNKIKKKYAENAVVTPCAKHPRYKGHRKPVNGCKECFTFYRGLKLKKGVT